jgi:hypothetical protein
MRDRVTRRVLGLAAFVPFLLAAMSASQVSRFRCQMTGLVIEASCCPDADVDGPRTATVSASECCDHEVLDFARPPSEVTARASADLTLPASFALPAPASPPVASLARRLPAAPPPTASLVLLKRALLI